MTKPFIISANTLTMLDFAIENFKKGKVSEPLNFNEIDEKEKCSNYEKIKIKDFSFFNQDMME